MKITRKILVMLVLTAVIIGCVVLGASAATTTAIKTGQGMKFYDYNNVGFQMHDDFEGGAAGSSGAATVRGTNTVPGNVTVVTEAGGGAPYIYSTTKGATSSDGYVKVNYEGNNGTLYIEPIYKTTDQALGVEAYTPVNGYVMEFDIATKATSNNSYEFNIQLMNLHSTNGGYINILRFKANNGKVIIAAPNSSQQNVSNAGVTGSVTAADTGKWVHVTILYVPGATADANGVIRVYANQAKEDRGGSVERTCLGEFEAYYSGAKVYPMGVRLGNQGQTSGDFCVDNILYYQSSKVCDPQYVSNLTDAEAFIEHVKVMQDTTISSANLRYESYLQAASLRGGVGNGSGNSNLTTAINQYNSFQSSVAALKTAAMNENLSTFKTKVQQIMNKKRGLANIETRLEMITDAEAFVSRVGELITKDDKYDGTVINLEKWRQYTNADKEIRTFVNRMERFKNAATVAALQRHYDAASELYSVANDVYSMSFPDFGDATEKTTITNAVKAYQSAATTLANKIQENNAQRFIDLVKLFENTTQTDWEADTGVIRNQWYLARGILLENNYKTSTEFNNAKTKYNTVNTFFFAKMMQEHVDVLNAKLAVFDNPSANYIDKAGVCKYVDNYLERNAKDIDATDPRIVEIKNKNTAYKATLDGLEIEYAEVLVENTKTFVEKMDFIATKTAYSDLKPLFEDATKFYYNMNIVGNASAGLETETVQAAVAAYETLRQKLIDTEVYGALFVAQMSDMPNSKYKDDHYAAFIECYKCEEYLDATYTPAESERGVGDYLNAYESMKSAYINKAELANEESKTAIDAVCSVRTFCGISELVVHVQNLLK